jgi:RNA polymerase sigma-70 factor (ECF subfamily)
VAFFVALKKLFLFFVTQLKPVRYINVRSTKQYPFLNQKEVIRKCKENDYSAQVELYNAYKNMLYNSCFRILKNREDAEDMVHDAFIKGFKKINQVADDVNIGAWLRRIAINTALDKIRKEKNTFLLEDSEEIDGEIEEIDFDDTEGMSTNFIKECIHKLKDKYSVILVLYLIEDYNHREIATQLNLKESTVRNQYARGKSQLLLMLQNNKENEFKRTFTAT